MTCSPGNSDPFVNRAVGGTIVAQVEEGHRVDAAWSGRETPEKGDMAMEHDPGSMEETGPQGKKIAMLVMNPCAPDARVEKEARALVNAGYRVRIFCTARKGLPDYEVKSGVEYVRVAIGYPLAVAGALWLLRWIRNRLY